MGRRLSVGSRATILRLVRLDLMGPRVSNRGVSRSGETVLECPLVCCFVFFGM